MPTLRQLQYLVALSQTGHFRLAAEKVGVSQPTLSAQLLALERRLGVALIERNRAPVILTATGQRILGLARQAVATVQDIHDAAQDHRKGMTGVMRLGLPTTIGPYLMPAVLPSLHASYPLLRLHLRENTPQGLPESLASGLHDMIIVPLPLREEDFVTFRLFREPLYLAVAQDHRLAACESVDPEQLEGEPVLTLEKGYALHEQVRAICQECGARLLYDYEGTSLSTLHQMTAMGLGLTFLPGLYVKSPAGSQAGIKLLKFRSKPLFRTIGLAWRNSSPDSENFRRFGNHVNETVRLHFPDFHVLGGDAQ